MLFAFVCYNFVLVFLGVLRPRVSYFSWVMTMIFPRKKKNSGNVCVRDTQNTMYRPQHNKPANTTFNEIFVINEEKHLVTNISWIQHTGNKKITPESQYCVASNDKHIWVIGQDNVVLVSFFFFFFVFLRFV